MWRCSLQRQSRLLYCFCLVVLLGLLQSSKGYAQTAPAPAAKQKSAPPNVPAGTLPASKIEEALRMLLHTTSANPDQMATQTVLEIEGLVIDQTLTKIGHDFYSLFYAQWDVPASLGAYTVVVRERPNRGISALISIEANDDMIVEMPLLPNYEAMEEAVTYALGLTIAHLVTVHNVSQQLEKAADDPGTEVY
ncbi:hypothetical protein F1C16_20460 (plasmid) [Hymenobacter sp. NBH84]|nr:hypothetical protein F1C16_20460 [Hymenobacter sp. NBH84]